MSKLEKATIHRIGDSEMVLLPAKIRKDKEYPFKKSYDLLIEISKDFKNRKGLFIRRL